MAISRADFWSFINELVRRNPTTMGISALDDALFVNFVIFHYLYVGGRILWGATGAGGSGALEVRLRCF